MTFPCTRCGLCCRYAGRVPELKAMALPNGTCRHLTSDSLCAIYDERPDICRLDRSKPPSADEREWYKANAEACNRLIVGFGADEKYLVKLEES